MAWVKEIFFVNWGHDKKLFENEKEFIDWTIKEGISLDVLDAHALLNQLENLGQIT